MTFDIFFLLPFFLSCHTGTERLPSEQRVEYGGSEGDEDGAPGLQTPGDPATHRLCRAGRREHYAAKTDIQSEIFSGKFT